VFIKRINEKIPAKIHAQKDKLLINLSFTDKKETGKQKILHKLFILYPPYIFIKI